MKVRYVFLLALAALAATPEVAPAPVVVTGTVAWVTAHWIELVAGLTLLVGLARVIVKLTPTPKDDTVLQKIVDFLKHLGLVIKE